MRVMVGIRGLGAAIAAGVASGVRRAAAAIDPRDVVFVAGLGLLGAGLGMIFPPLAFIATGAILVGVALFWSGSNGPSGET